MRRVLVPGIVAAAVLAASSCSEPEAPATEDAEAPAPEAAAPSKEQLPPKAEAEAAPEAKAPEPPPPSGYALLPEGTELRLLPDAAAPAVVLPPRDPYPSDGPLPGPARGVPVMVSGVDGDFLAVETLRPPETERHCEEPVDALEHFRLRFFVPKDAPGRVTTRAVTVDGADGTQVTLAAGTPVRRQPSDRFVAEGHGVRIEVALADDVVGQFYEPGEPEEQAYAAERLPEGTTLTFDGTPLQGIEGLPGAPRIQVHGHRSDADGVLALVSAGCLALQLRSSAAPAAADPSAPAAPALTAAKAAGLLGVLGTGAATEHEVRPGATVYWPDHRVAGQVVEAHRFTDAPEEAGAHRCFALPLGESELTLCFDPGDVHEVAPAGGLGLSGVGGSFGRGGPGLGGLGAIGSTGSGSGSGSGSAKRPTIRGALDKEEIRTVVRAHINEVKHCYEKQLTKDPSLEGKVTLQFTIDAGGKVAATKIAGDTLSDPAVGKCVAKTAKRWVFPRPRSGGVAVVSYPFVFKAS